MRMIRHADRNMPYADSALLYRRFLKKMPPRCGLMHKDARLSALEERCGGMVHSLFFSER